MLYSIPEPLHIPAGIAENIKTIKSKDVQKKK